jgi:KUP system potassium uptake protein
VFLVIDLAFLGANFAKILHGGWFPLLVGAAIFTLMLTWRRGRKELAQKMRDRALPLELLFEDLRVNSPVRVPGTAFFLAGNPNGTPPALLHNLKHNKVLHERVVILNVRTEEVPHVLPGERLRAERLDLGFWRMTLRFGFMDDPHVPEALKLLDEQEFAFSPMKSSFFLGRETILCTCKGRSRRFQRALFGWMSQNARDATSFFSLPPNCVVELGAQVEL